MRMHLELLNDLEAFQKVQASVLSQVNLFGDHRHVVRAGPTPAESTEATR